jgi:hypothetical protein
VSDVSRKPKLLEAGHPDNFQTPASALDCLLPHLDPRWTIWEPACGKGNLVRGLQERGYRVTGSDIKSDCREVFCWDFTDARPHRAFPYDCIVTNPPFSIKERFLARCYELDKPFALLLPITTFDSQARRKLFHRNGVELMFPDGRINFETPNGRGSSSWFLTCWFTWKLGLPNVLNYFGLEEELL